MTFKLHNSLDEYRKMEKVERILSEFWKRDYFGNYGHISERITWRGLRDQQN